MTILQALQHISEVRYFGVTMMLDVLRGSTSKRLTDAKLETVPEFGSLANLRRDELNAIIDWLLENHFMIKTKGQYPVLHPTNEGNHYSDFISASKLQALKKRLEQLTF